ncbi:peptidoglycan-recognition protein LC-like, partial [Temnothorax curvispinosus]|uniref:Peptidoglycan-recognition protein LC-like n=1 Tax=Temnothorax curvispinosus TaxID=300111 RepID=A0A6J1QYG7_9HYME
ICMLTLMQQQQQTLDNNHQSQTEQDYVNGVPAENHTDDRSHSEAERLARETAVVTPGNGSVGDSPTHWNDVDNDNEEEETDVEEDSGWITNQPISSTIVQQQQAFTTTNGDVILPNPDPSDFGDITVTNSTRVRVGNETIYNGPVTINQFVYTNPTPNQDAIELDVIRPSDNISNLSTSQDNGVPNESIFPQNIELNKVTQWLWTWKRAVLSCVLTLILLAIVVPITVHLTHQSDASVFPEIPTSSLEGTNVTDTSLRFVERDEWGALPPLVPLIKRKLPVPYVIISHSATSVCITPSDCAFQVRFLQYSHFNDFNFV